MKTVELGFDVAMIRKTGTRAVGVEQSSDCKQVMDVETPGLWEPRPEVTQLLACGRMFYGLM